MGRLCHRIYWLNRHIAFGIDRAQREEKHGRKSAFNRYGNRQFIIDWRAYFVLFYLAENSFFHARQISREGFGIYDIALNRRWKNLCAHAM